MHGDRSPRPAVHWRRPALAGPGSHPGPGALSPAAGRCSEGSGHVQGPVGRVGVLANLDKPRALPLVGQLLRWLAHRGIGAVVPPEVAAALGGGTPPATFAQMAQTAEFLVVLGGDGTLLSAARRGLGLPLLGVNLGHLGFLTELEEADLFAALPGLLAGQYELDERMMLECAVHAPSGAAERYLALNDVVVAKGPFARLLRLTLSVGGEPIVSYPGDGIIVSTPTGSTAYSLSAGGPVLHPHVRGMLVTPICPHTFYSRPLVVAVGERLRILPEVAPGPRHLVDVALTVDAQEGRPLVPGEWIEVGAAGVTARLVRRPGWDFYEVLRRKLAENGRVG
jgi:NAD+ kinase